MDPTLAELALEVALVATRSGEGPTAPLSAFRAQLLYPLRLTPVLLEPIAPLGASNDPRR